MGQSASSPSLLMDGENLHTTTPAPPLSAAPDMDCHALHTVPSTDLAGDVQRLRCALAAEDNRGGRHAQDDDEDVGYDLDDSDAGQPETNRPETTIKSTLETDFRIQSPNDQGGCHIVTLGQEGMVVMLLKSQRQPGSETATTSPPSTTDTSRNVLPKTPLTWMMSPSLIQAALEKSSRTKNNPQQQQQGIMTSQTIQIQTNNNNSSSVETGNTTTTTTNVEVGILQLSAAVVFMIPSSNLANSPAGRVALANLMQRVQNGNDSVAVPRTILGQDATSPSSASSSSSTNSSSSPPSSPEVSYPPSTGDKTVDETSAKTLFATPHQSFSNLDDVNNVDNSPQEQQQQQPQQSQEKTALASPNFPTLTAQVLQQNGQYSDSFPINSRHAQDFETDIFKGKLLVLVKPAKPEDDPYWSEHLFSKKKRIFVMQLQGKFKPTADQKKHTYKNIYFGGEITKPMRVGMLTKGVCNVLLRFLQNFVGDVIYSFGEDKVSDEKPRVVVPAHWAFQRLHVTQPGATPPPVTGDPFPESDADMKHRLKTPTWEYNTEDTYSFTMFTMYFDFVTWKIVNMPGAPLKMANFWNDADFDFVMYEHRPSDEKDGSNNKGNKQQQKKPKKHLQKDNRYLCSLRFKHSDNAPRNQSPSDSQEQAVGVHNHVSERNAADDDNDEEDDDFDNGEAMQVSGTSLDRVASAATSPRRIAHSESMVFLPQAEVEETERPDDDDTDEFFDAGESQLMDSQTESDVDDGSIMTASSWLLSKDANPLSLIDATVPAWVEMVPRNTNGGGNRSYAKYFALNIRGGSENDAKQGDSVSTIFRCKSDCEDYLENSGLRAEASAKIGSHFTHRISSTERLRRMLAYVLYKQQKEQKAIMIANTDPSSFSALERKKGEPLPEKLGKKSATLFAHIARAKSDRHWIEEWAQFDKDSGMILFYRKVQKKRAVFRIATTSIMSITSMTNEECPQLEGHDYAFLCIESIGRSTYLMFASEEERDLWLTTISETLPDRGESNGSGSSLLSRGGDLEGTNTKLIDVDSPVQEFMHNSSVWDCKKRRIYNCGTFSFRSDSTAFIDPTTLAQQALKAATETIKNESSSARHGFLKLVSKFKTIQIEALDSENKKIAFFLNLYHTMVLHAFLILGPPTTSLRFISLFKDVAYQVGDNIISLAEIEHCILRSKMSLPSSFLSRFVVPKSRFSFSLQTSDYRINFALNCGSVSNPSHILVYSPEKLDGQLDAASRLALSRMSSYQHVGRDVVMTLPKVCQWFEQDFGKPDELVVKLEPYFPHEIRHKLQLWWQSDRNTFDMSRIWIRYDDFSFTCRPLTLLMSGLPSQLSLQSYDVS